MNNLKQYLTPLFLSLIVGAFFSVLSQDAANLIAKGDSSYKKFDNNLALTFYSQALKADPANYEAAWKLSRAYVDVGEIIEDNTKRNEAYSKGEEYARKAVEIDSIGSKGHLFLSVALGRVALDAGKKEQVRLSKEVKAEVDKALALNPEDDIALHVLGRWNRKMATLGWIQRKFANIFLGGVPKDASVEKAAECFENAIEINPGHINHHLELAITYEELKRKSDAMSEYKKVLELPKKDADDDSYKELAEKKLNKLQ